MSSVTERLFPDNVLTTRSDDRTWLFSSAQLIFGRQKTRETLGAMQIDAFMATRENDRAIDCVCID